MRPMKTQISFAECFPDFKFSTFTSVGKNAEKLFWVLDVGRGPELEKGYWLGPSCWLGWSPPPPPLWGVGIRLKKDPG